MNARVSLDKRESSFTTKLVRPEGVGTWTFAPIPSNVSGHNDLKAKMRVRGSIDGIPLKSSLMAGSGELFIVNSKELRDKIGKQAGDVVKMTLEPDTSNSVVNLPRDLKKSTIRERENKDLVRENGAFKQEGLRSMDYSIKDRRNKGEPDRESDSTNIRWKDPKMMKTRLQLF